MMRLPLVVLVVVLGWPTMSTAQVLNMGSPASATSRASGLMFDVQATSTLTVTAIDLYFRSTNLLALVPHQFEVWTVTSGAPSAGVAMDTTAWKRVGVVTMAPPIVSGTLIPISLYEPVRLLAGQVRGFCLIENTGRGAMACYAPYVAGPTIAGNADVSVTVGSTSQHLPFAVSAQTAPIGHLHYQLDPVVAIDLAAEEILVGPAIGPCDLYSATSSLGLVFRNMAAAALPAGTPLFVSVEIDGSVPAYHGLNLTQSLGSFQTDTFTIPMPVALGAPGPHQLKLGVVLVGDGNALNDLVTRVIHGGGEGRVTSFPWKEDFENLPTGSIALPPLGWTQDDQDGTSPEAEWLFDDGASLPFSSAFWDHGSGVVGQGHFAVTDDRGDLLGLRLVSPCLDLGGLANPRLKFWAWRNRAANTAASRIFVDVIDHGSGTTTFTAWGPTITLLNSAFWQAQFLDLGPWAGSTIQLVFRADTANGSAGSPFAIDDIEVIDALPTPGQAAQVHVASFDLQGARNVNQDRVEEGRPGPFFLTAANGDLLEFQFDGRAGQIIHLLGGPLNPAAASFPLIGQMDIGGPLDPLTGLPTGIQVLASGADPLGLNPLFVTDAAGSMRFTLTMPFFPTGPVVTFQAAITTGGYNGSWVALTNAIELSAN
ncbi:MAG: hypothetical protein H6807_15715 [Planctomycetes bacterium]|nr:hypothetical protein [Planctomycetota bacterium]